MDQKTAQASPFLLSLGGSPLELGHIWLIGMVNCLETLKYLVKLIPN